MAFGRFWTAWLLVLFAARVGLAADAPPNNTPDPIAQALADEKARLEALKQYYEARKNAENAKKEADLAAAQASIGTVTGAPPGSPTGAITVQQDAGKAEATLMSARAAEIAASAVVDRILPQLCDKMVVIVTGSDGVTFQNYQQFVLKRELTKKAALEGLRLFAEAKDYATAHGFRSSSAGGVGKMGVPLLTSAGVLIDALSKLGSYFQSDYTLGRIVLDKDQSLFASAVGHELLNQDKCATGGKNAPSVAMAGHMIPKPADVALQSLDELEKLASSAGGYAVVAAENAKAAKAAADRAAGQAKQVLLEIAARYTVAEEALKRATTSYGNFVSGLVAPDNNGTTLLAKAFAEQAIWEQVSKAKVLQLDVRSVEGGYYTKRNLWTFLGTTPFYAMGGIVVTYALIDPQTNAVLAADVLPVHGGYEKVNDVPGVVGRGGGAE